MKPDSAELLHVNICGKKIVSIEPFQVVRGSKISYEKSRIFVHNPG
jgi:hypothetical protein